MDDAETMAVIQHLNAVATAAEDRGESCCAASFERVSRLTGDDSTSCREANRAASLFPKVLEDYGSKSHKDDTAWSQMIPNNDIRHLGL